MNILLISDNKTAYLINNISKMDIFDNSVTVCGFHENELTEVYLNNLIIKESDRRVWFEKLASDVTRVFTGSLTDFDSGVFANTNTDECYGYMFDFEVK